MTKNYNIFGKVYQINTIDSSEGALLHEELEIYPNADSDKPVDITINYLEKLEAKKTVLQNPSIHIFQPQSFRIELGNASIEFSFDKKKLTKIDFCIKQGGTSLRTIANKWLSYQFTNRKESIGLIFHELVLIPSTFFSPDMAIVHASAIEDNGVILFGGTGGVGKTSLELELCFKQNKSFFADDIVVINKEGTAFPNLSFPKIYAYNLTNNDEVKKRIFRNTNILNKAHWHIRKLISLSIVRRRVSPSKLYNHVSRHPQKIGALYFLVRDGSCKEVSLHKTSATEAAKLNRLVIETEYHVIYKHIIWDEYNSILAKENIKLSYLDLMARVEDNLLQALTKTNAELFIVKIPLDIKHQDFVQQVTDILRKK